VTRPSYDPMRAPAPRFPRGRFARIHDDDTVAALAEAYEALSYEERVRFAHRVTSAPDELLRSIADELAQADQEQTPVEPVPAGAPEAPAVNQAAAQVNPDATPPPPGTPVEGAGEPVPGVPTADPATIAGADTAAAQEQPAQAPPAQQPAEQAAPVPPPLPVPPEQLPQLPAAQLRTLAANVGVDTSGNKQVLAARIADAVSGEQPAITPEQVAADAASQQAEQPPTPDPAPADEQPTPDATAQTPAANAGPGQPAPRPTENAPSAPESAPEPAPGPDTPAPASAPTEGTQEAPQTPAAAADGTTTEGTTP
jgi:hypothetical protein